MAFETSSLLSNMLQMVSTSDHGSVVSMNLFVALLCACIVIGHLLEENRWMNESITALLIVSLIVFLKCFLDCILMFEVSVEVGDHDLNNSTLMFHGRVWQLGL